MDPDKWKLVKKHFESALAIDGPDRETYLQSVCKGDEELYYEILSLIEADRSSISSLDDVAESMVEELASHFSVGKRIAQYDIISNIGKGGMGDVYLALDMKLQRKVALKFLHHHLATLEYVRSRFMREARAAATLSHPNIVTVYEVSEDRGRPFIAMEYIEGVTLRDLINDGMLEVGQILKISTELCSGLSRAHQRSIIHRDIKPENIRLDNELNVKILDFGIAKIQDGSQITVPGSPLGTANYMSPEQARGDTVDHRTDVFSLGVVLHEMIAGKPPFKRSDFSSIVSAISTEQAPMLFSEKFDVPVGMQTIVDRALAKNRDDRYQSIDELMSDLKKVRERLERFSSQEARESSGGETKSIAVLYLKNLGNADDDYLCYGITEDLIIDLAQMKSLRVTPLRSVMDLKDAELGLNAIAEKLNVDFVLDGSILRTERSIRISVQLVDVVKGDHVWVERWEVPLDNLTEVKGALSSGITKSLGIQLPPPTSRRGGIANTDNSQAYEYFLRAKYTFDHKKDTQDLQVALGLYQRALQLDSSLVSARAGAAEVLVHQGKLELAREELEASLEDARSGAMRQEEGSVLRLLSGLHSAQSRWGIALELNREAIAILREIGDVDGEARALSDQISILSNQAHFDDAIAAYDRVVEINRLLHDEQKVAEAFKNMGKLCRQKGDYNRAEELYEESLSLARKQGNLALESACLGNLGNVHLCRDNLVEALRCYERALEIDERLGSKSSLQAWHTNIAHILKLRYEYKNALGHINEAVKISKELSDQRVYAHALASKSEIFLELGELEGAAVAARESLEISEAIDYKQGVSAACLHLGNALVWSDDRDAARSCYLRGLDVAEESGLRRNVAWAYLYLGELLFDGDTKAESADSFDKALDIAKEIEDNSVSFRAKAYRAAAAGHAGDLKASVQNLKNMLSDYRYKEDVRSSLLIQRLTGQLLFQNGESADDKGEGANLLREVMSAAESNGLVTEIKLVRAILK